MTLHSRNQNLKYVPERSQADTVWAPKVWPCTNFLSSFLLKRPCGSFALPCLKKGEGFLWLSLKANDTFHFLQLYTFIKSNMKQRKHTHWRPNLEQNKASGNSHWWRTSIPWQKSSSPSRSTEWWPSGHLHAGCGTLGRKVRKVESAGGKALPSGQGAVGLLAWAPDCWPLQANPLEATEVLLQQLVQPGAF